MTAALLAALALAAAPVHETASHRERCLSSVPCIITAWFGPELAPAALRVARCESRFDPSALNRSSGAAGVFQFLPSTWRQPWNPRRHASPFVAIDNVRAARVLYRLQGWRPWVCKP